MGTPYGSKLKLDIYGGSHDEKIGMTLDGIPKGERIDLDELRRFMARRAPGNDRFSTARKEADEPVFLSGLDGCVTTGERIEAVIYNTNQHSRDYSSLLDTPRPSHADFAAKKKYGESVDLRGGGHFSGRLTAPMCIAGGICLQILSRKGISIGAHISSIGKVKDTPFDPVNVNANDFDLLHTRRFSVLNEAQGEEMMAEIDKARLNSDSIGGVIECAVIGLPAGLGEHMFASVEGAISSIVFGIPAVKGIEFGNGFECASLFGSENNDEFVTDGKTITTSTNNCGGILGGMTNGMPVVFRCAMKPTPSIFKEQNSVDMVSMTPCKLNIKGRHDPCVVLRAVPVFEAAAAIAVYDLLCDNLI